MARIGAERLYRSQVQSRSTSTCNVYVYVCVHVYVYRSQTSPQPLTVVMNMIAHNGIIIFQPLSPAQIPTG
jgi:hypothetical protein